MAVRTRLDVALVERGLFPTRARAQAAVMAGRVSVAGRRADAPSRPVVPDETIDVEAAQEYVSRGGVKLANALDALGVDPEGALALDVGASTGGFTDCLLQRGAREVVAVDVGYGQLDWRLRQDPRVHVRERTNARELTADDLPYAADLVVVDVSFISAALVWPAVRACLAEDWTALVMVKPQFEVGRELVGRGGVVRDPGVRAGAARAVAEAIAAEGGDVVGAADSGLPGPKGNREIFLHARSGAGAHGTVAAGEVDRAAGA